MCCLQAAARENVHCEKRGIFASKIQLKCEGSMQLHCLHRQRSQCIAETSCGCLRSRQQNEENNGKRAPECRVFFQNGPYTVASFLQNVQNTRQWNANATSVIWISSAPFDAIVTATWEAEAAIWKEASAGTNHHLCVIATFEIHPSSSSSSSSLIIITTHLHLFLRNWDDVSSVNLGACFSYMDYIQQTYCYICHHNKS